MTRQCYRGLGPAVDDCRASLRFIRVLVVIAEVLERKGQDGSYAAQALQALPALVHAAADASLAALVLHGVDQSHPSSPRANVVASEEGVADQQHAAAAAHRALFHRPLDFLGPVPGPPIVLAQHVQELVHVPGLARVLCVLEPGLHLWRLQDLVEGVHMAG